MVCLDSYDSQKAARVWERVHPGGAQHLSADCLNTMISQLLHLAAVYQALGRQAKPPQSSVLKALSGQKQTQAASLRGIHILSGGPYPALHIPQVRADPLPAALRRCYATEVQLWTQLRLHGADSVHEPVLEALVAMQQEHCRRVAELIGQSLLP